jgi:hypothetical protein
VLEKDSAGDGEILDGQGDLTGTDSSVRRFAAVFALNAKTEQDSDGARGIFPRSSVTHYPQADVFGQASADVAPGALECGAG